MLSTACHVQRFFFQKIALKHTSLNIAGSKNTLNKRVLHSIKIQYLQKG